MDIDVGIGEGIAVGIDVEKGKEISEISSEGIGMGIDVGKGRETGEGIGVGINAEKGKGIGEGIGVGVGIDAGKGIGEGIGVGIDARIGVVVCVGSANCILLSDGPLQRICSANDICGCPFSYFLGYLLFASLVLLM